MLVTEHQKPNKRENIGYGKAQASKTKNSGAGGGHIVVQLQGHGTRRISK